MNEGAARTEEELEEGVADIFISYPGCPLAAARLKQRPSIDQPEGTNV